MEPFKVIIVEDVPLELKGTEGIFKNEIPEAEIIGTAESETSYWRLIKQQVPDLVLLDLMLPGLSGEELLPRLRGIRPASACPLPARSSSKCTARFLQGTRTTNYTLIFFSGTTLQQQRADTDMILRFSFR